MQEISFSQPKLFQILLFSLILPIDICLGVSKGHDNFSQWSYRLYLHPKAAWPTSLGEYKISLLAIFKSFIQTEV